MADIGDKLRSARKAKGMSIEDVEKITKIQRRYLAAIENNEFDQLPGDFYVRAFIRQYADVVGLDGKELLEDFQSEVPEAKPEEYVENSIDNKSEEIKRTTNSKKGLWKGYLPKAATVVGILLVILVVYLVYAHFFSGSNQQSANESESVTVSSHVTSSKSKSSSAKKSSTKTATKTSAVKVKKLATNSFRVTGMTTNRTLKLSTGTTTVWAQINVNGQSSWQGTLQANKSHSIKLPKNVKNVTLQLGNTQTTKVTIAGKQVTTAKSSSPVTLQLAFGNAKVATTSSSTSSSQSSSNATTTSQSTQSSAVQSSSTTQTQQSSQVNNGQTGTQTTTSSQNNGGQNNQ